ncbi:MAG: HPP family protein [Gemmobacter sp.]|nr:HPP family protein [Gemmobacter sp.]
MTKPGGTQLRKWTSLQRWRVRARWVRAAVSPAMARPMPTETLRAALGAGLALLLSGGMVTGAGSLIGEDRVVGLFLVAPLGATAFLVFAVPNSPLAQPWSAVVGNTVAALVAIAVVSVGVPVLVAAGLAVCGAMIAMALLRAMHPPGAAMALAIVLGGAPIADLGVRFAFAPVMVETAMLVALAVIYNRLTGRKYPFRQSPVAAHSTRDPASDRRLGLTNDDLADLLGRFNLSANIGAEDFGRILAAAEAEAARRRLGAVRCKDFMSRDLVTVTAATPLGTVADLFRDHRIKTLPVVDGTGALLGTISQTDLIQSVRSKALRQHSGFAATLMRLRRLNSGKSLRVGDVMVRGGPTVTAQAPMGDLIAVFAVGGAQAVPVLDEGRLVGIVTRSDLLAVLARFGHPGPTAPGPV